MEMNIGMGQWFLWGAIGLAAILALFGMTSWLRGNQKRIISGSAGGAPEANSDTVGKGAASSISDVTDAMGKASVQGESISAGVGQEVKKEGWGVGPWALISLLLASVLGWLVWTSSGLSGMSAIKWIFASLLGLGSLFAVMGFLQMIRRHPLVDEKRGSPRGLGFLTMITGLVLAGASWFVWQPKIASLGDLPNRISGYETKLSTYKSQITGFESNEATLRAENTRLDGMVSDLKKKLSLSMADADEVSRLTAVVKGLNGKTETLEDENNRLKKLVASHTATKDEMARLKGVVLGLKTDVSGLEKDVAAKNTEIARLKELLSKNGATDNSEMNRLNEQVSSLTTENRRMNSLIGKYRNDSEVQNAKIASLEAETAKIASLQTKIETQQAEIETLRNKPAVIKTVTKTVTVPAPATGGPVTALQLLRNHGNKDSHLNLVTPAYKMTRIKTTDLVNGKTGKYYRISLKSPDGKGYKFALGKYNEITPSAPFKASLDRVIADIKKSLDGRRTYQIYTRGKASAGYFRGKMDAANAYDKVEVLPRGANGRYDDQSVTRQYQNRLHNEDLPNLRGAYLQDYIARNYKGTNPVILEGKVSKSKDISKQSFDILLYVEE